MTSETAFKEALITVLGQALEAAGYTLEENPVQWSAGYFRFHRQTPDGITLQVAFQVLTHPDYPSRFRVSLRRARLQGKTPESAPAEITLARLLWDVFGVHVLPQADYWWEYRGSRTLGDALIESGKLLIGYGLPWLDGTLAPDS